MAKAVFLDRDGVINEMVTDETHGIIDSPRSIGQFKFIKNVKKAIKIIFSKGYDIIIVSNQPGIAKGTLKINNLAEMDRAIEKYLGINRNKIYYCYHKSEDNCEDRKPNIGLLRKAIKEHNLNIKSSVTIGDGWNDIVAGKSAGCKKTILIGRNDRTEMLNLLIEKNALPDHFADNLLDATKYL